MSIFTEVQDRLAEQRSQMAKASQNVCRVLSNFSTWFASLTEWQGVKYANFGEEDWGEPGISKLSSTKNSQDAYEFRIQVRLPVDLEFLDTELVINQEKVCRFAGKEIGKRVADLTVDDAKFFGDQVFNQVVRKRMTPA